jgi:succinate dehydrogenase / fumarate reductase iron-sulfur subunit
MRVTLKVWRQEGPQVEGRFVSYPVDEVEPEMSLLETLDLLNERLAASGERPVAFDSDCREGICGACGLVVDGQAHGPQARTTTCQLTMRAFSEGAEIAIEPFRAGLFPLLRDLVVDRSALDRLIAAGGFIGVGTGSAPEANALLVPRRDADRALEAAGCIGCGACVAACPNGSAALFVGAKLTHLGQLPQGQPERARRALALVAAADDAGFGACTVHGECQAACPKGISLQAITRMNRDFLRAAVRPEGAGSVPGA